MIEKLEVYMRTFYKIFCLGFLFFLSSAILNSANGQTALTITPKPTFMGKIPIGSNGSRNVSIFNITTGIVNISSISVTGSTASKFIINNNPNTVTLNPLQKVVLNITYQPTTTGMDVGILEVKTNSETFTDSLKAYGTLIVNNLPTFERVFGTSEDDYGNSFKQTSDGGYIIVGQTTKPDENYPDAYIVKTDSYGKLLWSKIYGGNYTDGASDVLILDDGSFLVVGTSDSYGTGTNDVFLLKLSATGDSLWIKAYPTTYDEGGGRIIKANDGGYIIGGSTKNTADQSSKALIMKVDTNGNIVWKKYYGGNGGQQAGDILPTAEGGYIFAGSTADPNTAVLDVYLVKIDGSGTLVWQKILGGSESDQAGSMVQTTDGGYMLAGYTVSYGAGSRDAYMVKIDANGNEQWHKTFGTVHSDGFAKVIQTPDGGYIGVGSINAYFSQQFIYDDLLVVKTDAQGNLIWQKTFGGDKNDYASKIMLNNDGGYVIMGVTSSYDPRSKIYLIGLNADGNITKVRENDQVTGIPSEYNLLQNYPNPFNPTTQISYTLKEESFVNLSVFDLLGEKIMTLVNNEQTAGHYTQMFDASSLSSGIYFYRLEASSSSFKASYHFISTKKMILIK